MAEVICGRCLYLKREVVPVKGKPQVLFGCDQGHFPLWVGISGLIRPAKTIKKAGDDCLHFTVGKCMVCGKPSATCIGQNNHPLCKEHYQGWSNWLNEHPGKREYFAPRQKAIHVKWLEVFLEFVAEEKGNEKHGD